MLKKTIALLILSIAAYFSIHLQLPSNNYINNPTKQQFSNERAQKHIEQLAKNPHAVAAKAHEETMQYVVEELDKMDLEVQIQEGNSSSNWGTFAKVKNVITRIKGTDNTKALLLMSHYDSAGVSSFGASDAGSGVAVILEGIRSFLTSKTTHKNDIIILFTDGEEIGLNGANLFVKEHPWTQDIGLVLNFEARGSGGPSFTLAETNDGNSVLMNEYIKANPQFPVANSLAYSIYKKLPNDTDLTVFRKQANIQGFNFAFIDDHYDYHSALDIPERLDNRTLSHQASYLMPLLNYFSNSDLTKLDSTENWVYFNSPLGMHSYPYSFILPLTVLAFVLFALVFIYGKKYHKLDNKEIGKGFLALFSALLINGLIGLFGWKLILKLYPNYNEILQGFPYNGHTYILFFVLLALAISFYIYKKVYTPTNTRDLLVAPIFIWLLINLGIAIELKGASFFIIPVFFTIGLWFFSIRKEKPSLLASTLLLLPAIFIIAPFIQQFPIALGMKIVLASTVFMTLLFGLLLPIIGFIKRKKSIGHLLITASIITFILAHFQSGFSVDQPKPNSLVFLQDDVSNKSYWLSYDIILDNWNSSYFSEEVSDKTIQLPSKYNTKFNHITKTTPLNLIASDISISFDTIINNQRNIRLCVTPKSELNSIIISSKNKTDLNKFSINGTSVSLKTNSKFNKKRNPQIAQYFIVDKEPLEIDFVIPKNKIPQLEILSVSYDLLNNEQLKVPKRKRHMIPKPFVITDAIIVKQNINF